MRRFTIHLNIATDDYMYETDLCRTEIPKNLTRTFGICEDKGDSKEMCTNFMIIVMCFATLMLI